MEKASLARRISLDIAKFLRFIESTFHGLLKIFHHNKFTYTLSNLNIELYLIAAKMEIKKAIKVHSQIYEGLHYVIGHRVPRDIWRVMS